MKNELFNYIIISSSIGTITINAGNCCCKKKPTDTNTNKKPSEIYEELKKPDKKAKEPDIIPKIKDKTESKSTTTGEGSKIEHTNVKNEIHPEIKAQELPKLTEKITGTNNLVTHFKNYFKKIGIKIGELKLNLTINELINEIANMLNITPDKIIICCGENLYTSSSPVEKATDKIVNSFKIEYKNVDLNFTTFTILNNIYEDYNTSIGTSHNLYNIDKNGNVVYNNALFNVKTTTKEEKTSPVNLDDIKTLLKCYDKDTTKVINYKISDETNIVVDESNCDYLFTRLLYDAKNKKSNFLVDYFVNTLVIKEKMKINIKKPEGKPEKIEVSNLEIIEYVKSLYLKQLKLNGKSVKFIYNGKLLQNERNLCDYKVKEDSTVFAIIK